MVLSGKLMNDLGVLDNQKWTCNGDVMIEMRSPWLTGVGWGRNSLGELRSNTVI